MIPKLAICDRGMKRVKDHNRRTKFEKWVNCRYLILGPFDDRKTAIGICRYDGLTIYDTDHCKGCMVANRQ